MRLGSNDFSHSEYLLRNPNYMKMFSIKHKLLIRLNKINLVCS